MADRKDARGDKGARDRKRNDEPNERGRGGTTPPLPIPPADSPRRIGREPAVDREAIAAREAGIYDEDLPPRAGPRGRDAERNAPERGASDRSRRGGRGRSGEKTGERAESRRTDRPERTERTERPERTERSDRRRSSGSRRPEPDPAPEPEADDWDLEEEPAPAAPEPEETPTLAAGSEPHAGPEPSAAEEPAEEVSEDDFLAGIFEPEPEETPAPNGTPEVEPPAADADPAPAATEEAAGADAAAPAVAKAPAGSAEADATAEPAPAPEAAPAGPVGVSGRWFEEVYRPAVEARGERRPEFRTPSGRVVAPLYGPTAKAAKEFGDRVGFPGEFPFTRGIHPTMYRGRLWTMRQYAGFASAKATNERFRYLLGQGQTGLSVAFDLPTQIGYDSDDPWSAGEVGKVGVPINSLADMETLLEGIPLDEASLSMTINSTALILLLMVVAVAKKQGVDPAKLRGTVQNDMLKEFAARNTFRFPLDAHLRLTTDLFRYSAANLPKWNLISVSGYHMREAGCTAAQEVAFTLADGIAYVEKAIEAGLAVDDFAGRMSFFFASHNDLFEEVAKFRAARRLWARIMTERFGVTDDRARMLRFHTQTAGSTLTAKQPIVNAVRVTIQALAAALGGTQSLHTNSWDEALGLPSQESALLALRTQQVIAHESGVANVVDALGGSPLVEELTDGIEADAAALIAGIDDMGGAVEAVRSGWMKTEIERSAYRAQQEIESGDQVVVGVNEYVMDEEMEPEVLSIDEAEVRQATDSLARVRAERDAARADAALGNLEISAAWGDADLPELILECVESYCTIGEICRSLETVLE